MITPLRTVRLLLDCTRSHRCAPARRIPTLLLAFSLLGLPLWAQTTMISGTVYVPNAVDPLPNALVYVTTGAVAPFVSGAHCPGANCQTAANAIPANALVSTYTAVDGTFTLNPVPENATYTLVIQAGKWRRQFTQAVVTTPITGLALDMPTTHAEGDIPLIAISTGAVDATECVLRDVGVADAEFTDDIAGGAGRIHLYTGNLSAGAEISASTPSESVLMGNSATLNGYDMTMFPCQGTNDPESSSYVDNLLAYTSAGGRVMATHWSLVWLDTNEMFMGATFAGAATWNAGQSSPSNGPATINTDFTGGSRLAQWIQNLGESYNDTLGQISIGTLRHDTSGVIAPTQTWLTLNSSPDIMQFTFNTPLGAAAAEQYGRVLFNEYHVVPVSSDTGDIFPAECGAVKTPPQMSPQEKMLEYALFDLSNFVTPIVLPTVSIALTTSPSDSIFMEGDTDDTITVAVTNTSGTLALDANTVLTLVLPTGLTATAMADTATGWSCNASTLTCTRSTTLAALASDSVVVTVSVAGDATGGAMSTTASVTAVVSNPTFSNSISQSLSLTLDQHAAVTWATPAPIADGTPLSSSELNAVGNTAGAYVYTPPVGTVLAAGSHTLSVTFTPSDQGTYPGTATATVNLVVNSPVSASASAPAATGFGSLPVASSSSSQSLTFTFLTPGVIGTTAVVTEGASGLDFSDAGTGTCATNGTGHVYSAGNTCTVNTIFKPQYPGTRLGAILLEDGSGNVLATAYVYGTGTGAELNFLPGLETSVVTSTNGIANPQGLALDGYGNLYTADYNNHAVYQTTPGGVTTQILDLTEVGEGGTPECLAVDGAGNLYIGDSKNNQVLQATPSGSSYTLNPSPVAMGLNSSGGVAVDQHGNVYIADTNNNRILLEARQTNGSYVQTVIVAAATSLLGTTLNTPFDVAVDVSGNVYISDTLNDRVIKETYSSEEYTPSLVADGLDWPTQLIVDGEGNVYVANNGHSSAANAHIYKETPSAGGYVQSVVPTSLTSSNLWGVAVGANGNVYLSDTTDTKVIEENFASSPSLDFAATKVGSISSDSPRSVTLENVGNAALTLASAGLTAPADFSQVAGSGAPVDCVNSGSVAAGANCNLSIRFAPTKAGNPLRESFVLKDNSLNGAPAIQNIALSGAVPLPSVALVLASSSATVLLKSAVTFTATITSSAGTPTGSIEFYDGTTLLGSRTLSDGLAAFTTSSLATGTHPITGQYGGTGDFPPVTSTALIETVKDFSLDVAASGTSSATVTPGGTATYDLVIGPTTGTTFPAAIALTVTGLPSGATATLTPKALAAGAGATNVTLTVQVPSQTASLPTDHFIATELSPLLLGMLFLPFAGKVKRSTGKRSLFALVLLLAFAGSSLLGLTGCGSKPSGFLGSSQTNYTLTVTGTSGALKHSTTLTLTIK